MSHRPVTGVSKTDLRFMFGELLKDDVMKCGACRAEMYDILLDLMMVKKEEPTGFVIIWDGSHLHRR